MITLYTRADCPLCDEAEQALHNVQRLFPFQLIKVNIAHDPQLVKDYGHLIPVVTLNDVELFYGKVSEVRLQRMLSEGNPGEKPKLSRRYLTYLERLKSLFNP